jgi:6-phosphogluconate dehydrogenase
MMTSAVFARYISSFKTTRVRLSKQLKKQAHAPKPIDLKALENAYRFARIINHHQGFEVMQSASDTYNWNLNLSEIARIWTNGCIIRSQFMRECISYLKVSKDLLSHQPIVKGLASNESAIAEVIQDAISNRIPLDTFWSAYNYWISMTTDRLPSNLIQAQRDYFGAHTYQRIDAPLRDYFHTNWSES